LWSVCPLWAGAVSRHNRPGTARRVRPLWTSRPRTPAGSIR
jgi:hypothetical protein